MRRSLILVVLAASGAAWAEGGEDGLAEQGENKAWHFRVGPVMAPRVRTRIRNSGQFYRPAVQAAAAQSESSSSGAGGGASVADPSAGYVDREYVDGYVKPDEGTTDSDSFIEGLTWNWGADNVGAQYSGGRIEFHTEATKWSEAVSSSVRDFSRGSGSESDRDFMLGVEAMGGWTFFDDDMFDASVDGGFRFYGSGDLKSESVYGTSVKTTTTRSEYRFVDSYDASGWTDVPVGSYSGTPGGPGRIIGAMPTRREELASSQSESAEQSYFYRSGAKLDYRIWDMRLGPTLGWKATDWLTIRGGVYGLWGIVDADLKTSGGVYRSKKSKSETVFGVAAGLSAQVSLTDNVFLQGGAEYDWWADDVSLKTGGGADAKLELSYLTVSLAIGIEF